MKDKMRSQHPTKARVVIRKSRTHLDKNARSRGQTRGKGRRDGGREGSGTASLAPLSPDLLNQKHAVNMHARAEQMDADR